MTNVPVDSQIFAPLIFNFKNLCNNVLLYKSIIFIRHKDCNKLKIANQHKYRMSNDSIVLGTKK